MHFQTNKKTLNDIVTSKNKLLKNKNKFKKLSQKKTNDHRCKHVNEGGNKEYQKI